MKEVIFYIGVKDKIQYACRFLRKAQVNKIRILVLLNKERLTSFSDQLWALSETDFIGHSLPSSQIEVRQASQVWLSDDENDAQLGQPFSILLNLKDEPATPILPIEKVVELVGLEDEDKQRARIRWRFYQQNRLTPSAVTVSKT